MPRSKPLRPFTTRFVNPLTRPIAAWVPGFAILRYVGRNTGRTYRTPINVFHRDGDYIFGLTYSSDVQWVKNVLAAGTAELEQRGKTIKLRDPKLFVDPEATLMPPPVRLFLRFMRVSEFLRMSPASDRAGHSKSPRT